LWMKRRVCR